MKKWALTVMAVLIGSCSLMSMGTKIETSITNPSGCNGLTCQTDKWEIAFLPFNGASEGISFTILNKGTEPIQVIWDESAYINQAGNSSRIIHQGVRLMVRDAPQAPSVIAPGTRLSDSATPSDNINYTPGQYGGWYTMPLFPLPTQKDLTGKTVGLYLVLKCGEAKTGQKYIFHIDGVTENSGNSAK